MAHRAVAIAHKDIGAGNFLQHIAEILGRHDRVGIVDHVQAHGAGGIDGTRGPVWIIDRDGIAGVPDDLGPGIKGRGRMFGHLPDARLGQLSVFGVKGADRPLHPCLVGDDVRGGAVGRKGADGQHDALERIDIARDDGMQRDQDMGGHQRGVDGAVRLGGMAPLARHDDLELVGAGLQRAGAGDEGADGNAGRVVDAVNLVDRETVEEPVIDHRLCPCAPLLSRLEDQDHGAVEIPRLGQIFGGPQQHGGVPVMAAGMHLARHFRGIGQPRRFLDGQRIHIGAQADGAL